MTLRAFSGGSSPQISSIRVSAGTSWFARTRRCARTARCFGPPRGMGPPPASTSSGPRTRNCILPPYTGRAGRPGQERSDLLRDVAPLRSDRQDADGIGQPLEVQLAAIQVSNALDRASQVNQALTAEDLAGTRLAAEPGREVQGPTAEPALDRHRLTGVQPDPDGEWEIRGRLRCLKEARLQLDRRPDRPGGGSGTPRGLRRPAARSRIRPEPERAPERSRRTSPPAGRPLHRRAPG